MNPSPNKLREIFEQTLSKYIAISVPLLFVMLPVCMILALLYSVQHGSTSAAAALTSGLLLLLQIFVKTIKS